MGPYASAPNMPRHQATIRITAGAEVHAAEKTDAASSARDRTLYDCAHPQAALSPRAARFPAGAAAARGAIPVFLRATVACSDPLRIGPRDPPAGAVLYEQVNNAAPVARDAAMPSRRERPRR